MNSDRKIVLTIIACFLVIGIYNYSASGVFLTPFFLNYFIFSLVSIWFLVKGIILGKKLIYAVYTIGILGVSVTHPMTIQSIAAYFKIRQLEGISLPPLYEFIGLLLFFMALCFIEIRRIRSTQVRIINWIPTVLLMVSAVATFYGLGYWQVFALSAYILSYLFSLRQSFQQNQSEFQGVGYQLFLFFVLENIRFLSTL